MLLTSSERSKMMMRRCLFSCCQAWSEPCVEDCATFFFRQRRERKSGSNWRISENFWFELHILLLWKIWIYCIFCKTWWKCFFVSFVSSEFEFDWRIEFNIKNIKLAVTCCTKVQFYCLHQMCIHVVLTDEGDPAQQRSIDSPREKPAAVETFPTRSASLNFSLARSLSCCWISN